MGKAEICTGGKPKEAEGRGPGREEGWSIQERKQGCDGEIREEEKEEEENKKEWEVES